MIRKIFKKVIYPVFEGHNFLSDMNIFDFQSVTGGTLEGKRVLIFMNDEKDKTVLYETFNIEKCQNKIIVLSNEKNKGTLNGNSITSKNFHLNTDSILADSFDAIINMIYITKDTIFSQQNTENQFEYIKLIYQLNQWEGNYFISKNKQGHILNICIYDIQASIDRLSIKSMTEGLGLYLGRHGIIINGITAAIDVPRKKVVQTAAYLISRFGEILAGEVLNLKELN